MRNLLYKPALLRALPYVTISLLITIIIELARRADTRLPLPFFILMISVIVAGWRAGTLAGGACGFIAGLYILYLSAFNLLPAVLPDPNQAALLAALLFSGSGLLFAYFKTQREQLLQNVLKHAAQLQQKEDIYQTLAEASQDVIARYDKDFRHTYVNPEIFKVSGKHPSEYLGRTIREVGLPEELCAVWEKSIESVFLSGKPDFLFYDTTDRNGLSKTIDWRAFPEFNRDGSVGSVIKMSRDVTERREFEKGKQKQKHLETLGMLAAGIAHDFNNILTILFGQIALLKNTLPGDHSAHAYIHKMEEAFERATHLTNQVLTFSKEGSPCKERLDLADLIEKVALFDLSDSRIKLVFATETGLWPAEVDRTQMEQVFSNLATNAKQAMPDGGQLYIKMKNVDFHRRKMKEELKQEKYIKITVQDEGAGIEEQHLHRIFDPYFSTRASGNGLGLATVYSNVIKHDGYISVKSKPGEGTLFSIYLPALEMDESEIESGLAAVPQENALANLRMMDG